MKESRVPILRQVTAAYNDQRGQSLPIVAFMLVVLLGFAGLVVDFGHCYLCYRQLQASTDAAALAGAGDLPNSTAAATASSYGSVSGGQNVTGTLNGVTMVAGYPTLKCLTTLVNQGEACISPAKANAVQVKQQVSVPLTFAGLFGVPSMSITATSTAAMRGSSKSPYNVAIIVDTTGSMNTLDNDSNCNSSRISCAISGVQQLLSGLSPCGESQSNCGSATKGNVSNPVDTVSLFVFPGLSSPTQAEYDYNCSGKPPKLHIYSYPTYPTYQVVPFQSDYRTSDTATTLNPSSNLVTAAGGKPGCPGMAAPYGMWTYYAGVIYAAQAALVSAKAANPGTENVMILLSDGDSNVTSNQMTSTNTKGIYPSTVNQCHQAISAAQAATAAGTLVYAVAYGAEASGCSTDSPALTPCQTMQQIASNASTFYSDYTASGGTSTCISDAHATTNLNEIFSEIVGSLSLPRLIPDNTP